MGLLFNCAKDSGPIASEKEPSASILSSATGTSSVNGIPLSSSVGSSSNAESGGSSATDISSFSVTALSSIAPSSSVVVSSSVAPSSSSTVSAGCTNTYGVNTVNDCRDNTTYKTVLIGTQTWMAENLNSGTMVPGKLSTDNQSQDSVIEKYCLNDELTSCNTDGGLYQWAEAMGLPSTCNYTTCSDLISTGYHQGICPWGWHIPKTAEWKTLDTYLGTETAGTKMRTTTGWSTNTGSNSSGFSGMPVGHRAYSGGFFNHGRAASFWEPAENGTSYVFSRYLSSEYTNIRAGDNSIKTYGLSVRCLKDSP